MDISDVQEALRQHDAWMHDAYFFFKKKLKIETNSNFKQPTLKFKILNNCFRFFFEKCTNVL